MWMFTIGFVSCLILWYVMDQFRQSGMITTADMHGREYVKGRFITLMPEKDYNDMKRKSLKYDIPLEEMREMLKIQGSDGNWNYDMYMFGMYNGMELMMAMAEGREPVYLERPDVWVEDMPVSDKDRIAMGIYKDAIKSEE